MTATDTDTDTATDTDTGTDTTTTASTDTTDTTGSPTGATDTDTDTTGSSGTDATTTGLNVVPCTGIDILFVVDNSTGMAEEHTRLVGAAYAFVQQVAQAVVVENGVHIGVITTDEPEFVVPTDPMTMLPTTYTSGFNYMVWDPVGNPMLQTELNTALAVGEAGDVDERPMEMMIEAVAGDTATSGFNVDFVREDSLMVIVIVTDEEDDLEMLTNYGSVGDPPDWVDGLTAIKDGIRRDFVPLALIPKASACQTETDAPRLQEFADTFPRGATHDVCDAGYATFLNGEVASIGQACSLFAPP